MTTNVDRCSEWRALASCRLDGELDELQTARLEQHLLGCAACRAWAQEIATFTRLLLDSEPARPARPLELRGQALRRRVARASAVGATAASAVAAAVAAFALGVPSSGVSLFSSGNPPVASVAPCQSCMKKQAVRLALAAPLPTVAPTHVTNPAVEPGAADDEP